MVRTLESREKEILLKITKRFLRDGRGTPSASLRKSLGRERALLDRLLQEDYLKLSGAEYLPTYLAVEQQDADLRNMARSRMALVLESLQNLYKREEGDTFQFPDIVREAKRIDPTIPEEEIRIGILLAMDLRHCSGWTGDSTGAVTSVSLSEAILDFESVDASWDKIKQQKEKPEEYLLAGRHVAGQPPWMSPERTTAAEAADFSFVRDGKLKGIVERDYDELQRVKAASAIKSRLILAGGLIEALLLDALQGDEPKARVAKKAEDKPLDEWNLSSLIDVAVELGFISAGAQKFGHSVREFRNLVHPGREIRFNLRVAVEEADIAEKVLGIVIRDLRDKGIKP